MYMLVLLSLGSRYLSIFVSILFLDELRQSSSVLSSIYEYSTHIFPILNSVFSACSFALILHLGLIVSFNFVWFSIVENNTITRKYNSIVVI